MTMASRPIYWLIAACVLFFFTGCATDVVLRQRTTGRTVICPGEYAPGGFPTVARMRAAEDQSDCIWRFQQRGFEPTQGG
jgi:hypothetical protein